MKNTVILLVLSAIVVAGEVMKKDSLIEVTDDEARDLLRRGKAVVHEAPVDDDQVVTSSVAASPQDAPQDAADDSAGDDSGGEGDGGSDAGSSLQVHHNDRKRRGSK